MASSAKKVRKDSRMPFSRLILAKLRSASRSEDKVGLFEESVVPFSTTMRGDAGNGDLQDRSATKLPLIFPSEMLIKSSGVRQPFAPPEEKAPKIPSDSKTQKAIWRESNPFMPTTYLYFLKLATSLMAISKRLDNPARHQGTTAPSALAGQEVRIHLP